MTDSERMKEALLFVALGDTFFLDQIEKMNSFDADAMLAERERSHED